MALSVGTPSRLLRVEPVDESYLWVALVGSITLLTVTSTISFVLRMPSRARLGDVLAKAGREAELKRLVENLPRLSLAIGALRSGSSIAVVLLVLALLERGEGIPVWLKYGIAFGAAWLIVLVFGVTIAGAWARYAGEMLLALVLPGLHVLSAVLSPLIAFLRVFESLVRRLSGVPLQTAQSQAAELEQEILNVVSEGEIRGAVDEEEKEMIESVIDLRDTHVEAIMTPRTEIEAVNQTISLDQLKQRVGQWGHSRIPVYEETIDEVVGMIYAKDLLQLSDDGPFEVTRVMRPAMFIPETKLVRDLLHEFQDRKVHIAVVLDEYGGTAGLVTIEDILEELVGEIVDEYEPDEPAGIRRIDDHTVEVDARMRIDDLNDELNVDLPEDDDYETLGGFVSSTLGKIPTVGERFKHQNITIDVIEAEPRKTKRLRLHIAPAPAPDQKSE